MRTPLGNVRGLGSAKDGVGHFWTQRLTAIALVPLLIIFVFQIVQHLGDDYTSFTSWIASPLTAVTLVLLIIAGFYHMKLGLQIVIEDYIHAEGLKLTLIVLNNFFATAAGVASIYSVLKISFLT